MRYLEVAEQHLCTDAVAKEQFLVKATYRELRQATRILRFAQFYPGICSRYPNIQDMNTILTDTLVDLHKKPEGEWPREQEVAVDVSGLELLWFVSQRADWRSLKLEPDWLPAVPVAPCMNIDYWTEPVLCIVPKPEYL